MALIGSTTPISLRPHRVRFQQPDGAPVPNGDGGFTQEWADIPPPAFARISPATPGLMERIASDTTSTTATHVVTVPWRPGITTRMRLLREAQATPLFIVGVLDPDDRHVDLLLACAETPPEGQWSAGS